MAAPCEASMPLRNAAVTLYHAALWIAESQPHSKAAVEAVAILYCSGAGIGGSHKRHCNRCDAIIHEAHTHRLAVTASLARDEDLLL